MCIRRYIYIYIYIYICMYVGKCIKRSIHCHAQMYLQTLQFSSTLICVAGKWPSRLRCETICNNLSLKLTNPGREISVVSSPLQYVCVYLVVAVWGRKFAAKHTYTNSHGKDSFDCCGLHWNRNLANLLKVHPCSKRFQTAKLQVHAYFWSIIALSIYVY